MCFHYCQKIEQKILILRASRSAPELLCEPSYERLKVQKHVKKNTKSVKKCQLEFRNASTIDKNKVYRVGLKPISGPRLCCKDARSSILRSVRVRAPLRSETLRLHFARRAGGHQ